MQEPIVQPAPIKSKRIFPKILLGFLIVVFLVLGALLVKAYQTSSQIFVNKQSIFTRVKGLITSGSSVSLIGEDQNQINILLLGYGGEGHDGPYLTDSIILASINPQTNKVLLTSIPRDYLWNDTDPQAPQKINSAFAYGLGGKGDFAAAGANARAAVEKLTGLTIPYFFSIDFSGFKEAVDQVGGLDINVPNGFSDSQYPDNNFGYLPTQTFTAGQQHMDGARALIYARSRHGDNNEGSDFARSKRQSLILNAFETKVRQQNLLANPTTLNALFNIVSNHLRTNMQPQEILHLEQLLHDGSDSIFGATFDPTTNLVCEARLNDPNRSYVLQPCDGVTQDAIKNWFINELQYGDLYSGVQAEKTTMIIENAGTDTTKFEALAKYLRNAGITVYEVTYKGLPITQSALYELNSKPNTEELIGQKLGITHQPKPDSMKASTDLVLIVGTGY